MHLGVYTIEKTLFEGEVEKIVTHTTTGEITVLNDHIPLVSRLLQGETRITNQDKKEVALSLGGGFLEIQPENRAVILAEQKSS